MTTAPRFKFDHSAEQRDCALYYVDVIDHDTGQIMQGDYIGETGRATFTRFLEHLYDQPFGDRIVGVARVDPRVFRSKDEVLAAEREAVERLKPRLNYEWNLGNADRIPIWKQRAQRAERDAARGVPSRWLLDGKPNPDYDRQTATAKRPVPPNPRRPAATPQRRPARLPAKWRRRRNWAAVWLGGTLTLWLALALTVAYAHLAVPVLTLLPTSAGAVSLLYTPALPTKRARRRAWLLIVLATLILVGLVTR